MRVRELIEKLQEMDQDAHIVVCDPPDYASDCDDDRWYASTEVWSFGDEVRIE